MSESSGVTIVVMMMIVSTGLVDTSKYIQHSTKEVLIQ